MVPLKTIKYRGGIIKFSIPASWREEYNPSGGATFFENTADSGTLRVNVLTFGFPQEKLPLDAAFEALTKLDGSRVVERLPNGNAIARYVEAKPKNDKELHIHNWEIAFPLKPSQLGVAVFTYTLLASQASKTPFLEEIQVLDASISQAQFTTEIGLIGDYF